MNLYSSFMTGTDGRMYGVRLMASHEEICQLQTVGVIGEIWMIEGMQRVADEKCAMVQAQLEKDLNGSTIQ